MKEHNLYKEKSDAFNANNSSDERKRILILGGGIAGLSAGHFLKQHPGVDYRIVEGSDRVGGLAASFKWHDVDCDFAPHRLYSDDKTILNELFDLVECHRCERKSQIIINDLLIQDPVNAVELFVKTLPFKALYLASSYAITKLKPTTAQHNFLEFVQARYGKGLTNLFFKPYAEKLFGIPAQQISKTWGESKVRVSGLKDMINRSTKLYFDHFYYPKQGGYGAFAEALCEKNDGHIDLGTTLDSIEFNQNENRYRCYLSNNNGSVTSAYADAIISTLPLTVIAQALGQKIKLNYRSAKLVYLHLDTPKMMDNHWLYIVNGDKRINRIAEFNNFTPQSAERESTVICAEITNTTDFDIAQIIEELIELALIKNDQVLDTKIIDLPYAYPIYDLNYERQSRAIFDKIDDYPNMHLLGRQAQFKHQDIDEIFSAAKNLVNEILI